MEQLKQPQLGQTILNLRQLKKLTQEELVELCNINVRTLQRIEAGEVTPRDFTIRSILSALEYDIDQVQKSITQKSGNRKLQVAWVAGAIYFILGVFEAVADFTRFAEDLPFYFNLVYTSIKLVAVISFGFFMMGFMVVGEQYKSSIVKIGAWLMMATVGIMGIYDIISLFSPMTEEEFWLIKGGEGVMFGGADIVFGIGLFKLTKELGNIAKLAGVLEILAGAMFLTFLLALPGLFIWSAAIIVEVVILYQCYDERTAAASQ
jgi:transcriptional regulator with XRE-family HTH domain